jgi:predicted DNA-binding protein with PD1-like motif
MKHQQLQDGNAERVFVLVFDTDDEVSDGLTSWARTQRISAAAFTGIGAFRRVTVGYFDPEQRKYLPIEIDEQVEVLSLAGNIALADGSPKVHAHVVLGKRDGTAHGGHLLSAHVRPTLELVVRESGATMRRTMDAATGLPLINPSEASPR